MICVKYYLPYSSWCWKTKRNPENKPGSHFIKTSSVHLLCKTGFWLCMEYILLQSKSAKQTCTFPLRVNEACVTSGGLPHLLTIGRFLTNSSSTATCSTFLSFIIHTGHLQACAVCAAVYISCEAPCLDSQGGGMQKIEIQNISRFNKGNFVYTCFRVSNHIAVVILFKTRLFKVSVSYFTFLSAKSEPDTTWS